MDRQREKEGRYRDIEKDRNKTREEQMVGMYERKASGTVDTDSETK